MKRTWFEIFLLCAVLLCGGLELCAQYEDQNMSYGDYIYDDGLIGVTSSKSWYSDSAGITVLSDIKELTLSFNAVSGNSFWNRNSVLSYTLMTSTGTTTGTADLAENNRDFSVTLDNLKEGDTLTFSYGENNRPQYSFYDFIHSKRTNTLSFYAYSFAGFGYNTKRFDITVTETAGQPLPDVLATLLIGCAAVYLLRRQRRIRAGENRAAA